MQKLRRHNDNFAYPKDEILRHLNPVANHIDVVAEKALFIHLFRYDLDVGELARLGFIDDWFVLDQIKRGQIHLRALWLNFSLDTAHIKKVRMLKKFH